MKTKTGLIGLSATLALALWLPQAKADTMPSLGETLEAATTVEQPTEEALGAIAEEEVAAEIAEHESTEVMSVDAMPSEAEASDVGAVEDAEPETQPSAVSRDDPLTSDPVFAEDPRFSPSISSRDLQLEETPLTSEGQRPTAGGQPFDVAQRSAGTTTPDRWHFLVVPYIYIPLSISGSANFNNLNGNPGGSGGGIDFELEPNEITTALRNSLNFAFLGGFEAWNPTYKFGALANFDYVSLSTDSTVEREVRFPGAADFVPTEINADLTTQLMRADLLGGYRFYDPARVNPEGVHSEYDLGPFVFDAVGGLSLIQVNTRLGLTTNLGGSGQFDNSRTIVSPLIGGRARWNANPKLAVIGAGTISGFGIGGLMQYGLQGGVDWMFSGNTTLGAGYRFGFTDYNSDRVSLNVDQHGPYINIGFRF
ncbi:hypothetical protein GFS31_42250 (plasmid) [Leptolyngbya sp. BL0902]|uniref:hypothetical protein n=1 Tax=Leptolyngbya sp. BL0902 TaxID=1115757 RepID=UPI0018E8585F|nr:hypothetical protein [Leptolyngbya sp. BL0902]QQE67512.1 hypothetical protein GFS31_42250 [Leptolyngbya sp. BL0902]